MSYWSWDSSLSVGIDFIDAQHRRILDYINELDVAKRHNDVEKVSKVLNDMVDYTNTHFVCEEDIMRQIGYPLVDSHKEVHDAFAKNILNYARLHKDGQDITRKLMSDLKLWLTTHIKNDDKDFAPYAAKYVRKASRGRILSRFFLAKNIGFRIWSLLARSFGCNASS